MDTNRCVKLVLMLVLAISFMLHSIPISNVVGQPELKPTEGWGMFFETTGDINININESGVAVRIELPREFLEGVIAKSNRQLNNDTYFIRSDISSDYYYYKINDTSEYYPYNENGPYNITIQKPPEYKCTFNTTKIVIPYEKFTAPRFVFFEGLKAPQIAGIYNILVYIAPNVNMDNSSIDYGEPIFSSPPEIFQVHVSMREDPGYISGYIIDDEPVNPINITNTKGVVYAIEVNTGMIGRGFVDQTGFFNVTGLYAGEYRLEGSAGLFNITGFAYSPTLSQSTYAVNIGAGNFGNVLPLDRGFILNGSLRWVNQLNLSICPLDPDYYLGKIGITNLTYTVEAYDESGKIVASDIYKSICPFDEMYQLILRNGTKYFSYPALGSEYSGFGQGTYTIKIWAYGFVMRDEITVGPLIGRGYFVNIGALPRLQIGGVISGKIRLRSGPQSELETPREGELKSFGTQTGKLFGGNILIHLYNSKGALKGVTVLDGTNETLDPSTRIPNGTVLYADYSSGDQIDLLRFYILGFSEFHNKTYSGSWQVGSFPGPSPWDYGLEAGTYYVKIWIRGYVQEEINVFTLNWGGNVTQTIDLRRGGSTTVTVTSNVVRPGTRWPQQPTEFWRFIDEDTQEPTLCPPPRIRIYFYSSLGAEVGYAETILYLGGAGVLNNTATLNFTGHNWLIEDIIYRGFIPNALVADDYTLKGHTYGYIHAEDITITISLSQFSPTHVGVAFPLLLGCFIGGAVNFAMNDIFLPLTEDTPIWTHAILDGTTLMGTYVADAQTDWPDFSFTTYGFYGRGHFFYVDPQGYRWKDYGLENGTYNILIPEFGFTRRFLQEVDTSISLAELGWGSEVFFSLERLVKISGNIQGYNKDRIPVVLVWATIDTDGRTAYSFDGDFHVHVPSGTYDVTVSCPGYIPQSRTGTSNDQVSIGIIVLEQSGDPFP